MILILVMVATIKYHTGQGHKACRSDDTVSNSSVKSSLRSLLVWKNKLEKTLGDTRLGKTVTAALALTEANSM